MRGEGETHRDEGETRKTWRGDYQPEGVASEKNFRRQGLPNDQLSEMGGLLSEDQIGH